MKSLDRYIEKPLDFSKGMWWHNVPVELGTDEIENFASESQFRSTTPEGYFDHILNFDFDSQGRLVSRPPIEQVRPNTFQTIVHFPLTHRWSYAGEGGFGFPTTLSYAKDTVGLAMKLAQGWLAGEDHNYGVSWSTTDATIYGSTPKASLYYNGFWYVYTNGQVVFWVNAGTSAFGSTTVTQLTIGTGIRRALVWRDRAFGIGGNKLYWSKATDPANFVPPDGGSLQLSTKTDIEDIIVWQDRLYILDRAGRIWALDYSDSPDDGSVTQLTNTGDLNRTYNYNIYTLGISNFAVSDGQLFVCDVNNIYAFVNSRLIPIGDPLNMHIGGNHMIDIWDIGYGLLAVVHSTNILANQSGGWSRMFVYHHNQNAWTEYDFHLAAQAEGQSNRDYFPLAVANLGGASIFHYSWKNSGNDFVYPVFLDESPVDDFGGESTLDKVFRTLEGASYQVGTPIYKLKSPVTYLDDQPAKYKKLKLIQMNAYFRGDTFLSYHSWQVRPIPSLIINTFPARIDLEYAVDPEAELPENVNQGAGYIQPYQRIVNQRMRGFRFDWSYTPQDAVTNTWPLQYLDRVMIESLSAWFSPVGKRRDSDVSEMGTKNRIK